MDSIEWMRVISVISLVCWTGAATYSAPLLWQRRLRGHPMLFLLLLVAALFCLQSIAFMESAWQLDVYPNGRVVAAVTAQRLTSICAAAAVVGILRCIVRHGVRP